MQKRPSLHKYEAVLCPSLQDIPSLFDPGNATGGNAFLQVWHDRTAGATYSHFCDVLAITSLCIVGFLNALFAMTAASRMVS